MNREVLNGLIVGLAIGLFASIFFIPEEWMAIKRRLAGQIPLSSPEDYGIGSAVTVDEEVH